jgi:iron complex outermembrane receptor protein
VDRVGTYTTSLGRVAKIRANGKLQWIGEKWMATYTNRFVDKVTNIDSVVTDTQEVDSYLQHDVSVGYDFEAFGNTTQFTLGVENVFDEGPPFVEGNTSNGFDSGTFTARGRYFYLRASMEIR